jgi:hypothetical protein
MTNMHPIMRRFGIGIAASILAIAIGLVVELVWGRIYGEWGWQYVAIALLIFAIMIVAALEEFLRPPNPYKHLDPRFSFMDSAPTGQVYSTSSSMLWNLVPVMLTMVALAILAI